MKLQVAFDDIKSGEALKLMESCGKDIDIAEAGTLLILKEGLGPLKEMRKRFPEAVLLADPKIMDAPAKMAKACFEAGADIVTVMAAAGPSVISKVIDTARGYGGKVFVDLLGTEDPVKAAREADMLGADFVCLHASTEGGGDLSILSEVKSVLKKALLAAAGGINEKNLAGYRDADVIIVGSAVCSAPCPCEALRSIREKIDELS